MNRNDLFATEEGYIAMLDWLSNITRSFMRFDETSAMLNNILYEARLVGHAEAGTVYLVENGELVFSYTHNDRLFPVESAHKYAYANSRLPIDERSIAGYCATSRMPLNLPDVRHLPANVPFSFNDSFDQATGYKTMSVFVLPLIGLSETLLGVIQLINSTDENGAICSFTRTMEHQMDFLAVQAATALERSILARSMIHRMQMMAAICDPRETGPHAERVGAIAAEVYQYWAEQRHVPVDNLREFRSLLRLAAMVHDLGKVAIPKEVLKKPGKLDDQELAIMQTHCTAGADLFFDARLELDVMSRDVALHHHQKWNGNGYTGGITPPLAGEAIPLAARITAVADVFDALVSPRCYKKAWAWEDAVAMLQQSAGEHFDPEVVNAFMHVQDIVARIFERYPDVDGRDDA